MSAEAFHGTWQIVEVVNISNSRNLVPAVIHGAIFILKDNGEIKWQLGENIDKGFPLFQCDCYEVVNTFVGVCIQMGAVSGHIFEFWVDRPVPRDMMLLTFEGWCMLQCQQKPMAHAPLDFPFSFLPALEEGYFSDLKLPLENAKGQGQRSELKEVAVHSTILDLAEPRADLADLSKLDPKVLSFVLHFLYSQSLPEGMKEEELVKCVKEGPEGMEDFRKLCDAYVHRMTLKEKIVKLVNDVHSSIDSMTSAFKEHAITSPARFSFVAKLALRDGAVAFLKLVELCVIYGTEAPQLERNESLEILRYAKSRLPIFLRQLVSLLRNVKNDFATVRPFERNEIASHVAPEIEKLLGSLAGIAREGRDASSEIWSRWSASRQGQAGQGQEHEGQGQGSTSSSTGLDSLTEALYGIFRKREVLKLHHLQAQLAAMYLYLAQKKENFEEMSHAVKTRCVSRNLEQLLEELPVFLLRLEEIMMAFDDRFQWKDFKFCLQLAISQVCQTVKHLRNERSRLQKFLMLISELVQRDEFHQSLINLGLIEVPEGTGTATQSQKGETEKPKKSPKPANSKRKEGLDRNPNDRDNECDSDLNLMGNVCSPGMAKTNFLAKNAFALFETQKDADMVFEIIQDGEPEEIPAHRVIVAARCDWFRRALLSGMKESIQKRISIHDCPAPMFRLFLRFIYTGQLPADASLEVLSDLIAIADRYEMDSLKLYCEHELAVRHLDEASVIFLLSMSDQYNARTLRSATLDFIAANPGIMGKEMFEELSPELQMEVYDITMWSKPKKVYSVPEEIFSCPRYMLVPDSPSDEDSSAAEPNPGNGGNAI